MPNRTAIKNALLAALTAATFSTPINGVSTWVSTSRRLKMWNQVDKSAQPALFLVQHRESYIQSGVGTPARRYLDMGAYCYAPTGAEDIIGDDLLDIMEAAIEAVFVADDQARDEFTLGGLCYWCRITRDQGLFIRDPGDLDDQALLVMPIRVLMP